MNDSLSAKVFKNRWLMRAPIGLFRAGLGFIFGRRLILLEHVGRTSGDARYVVLEAVTSPSANAVVIASAMGTSSQWFRNLVAEPHCHVSIGVRRRVPALAEVLDTDVAKALLFEYQTSHPRVWKELESTISALHDDDPDFVLPLVRLTLQAKD